MQSRLVVAAMNQIQHIITGAPAVFAKSINKLAAASGVSLSVAAISYNDSKLAAVINELAGSANSPGSLIEIRVAAVKDGGRFIADLQAENPLWSVRAAFAAKGEESKAAAVLVVAVLRQP